MVGLPGQQLSDIADDLLFLKKLDVDMAGIGPYVGHSQTPLDAKKGLLHTPKTRLELALKSAAILRLLMPDINIASTTALETLGTEGRKDGVLVGCNVIMPNITPEIYKTKYLLYESSDRRHKSCDQAQRQIQELASSINATIAYNQSGDSLHYQKRRKSQ